MSESNGKTPTGWERSRLAGLCQINPKLDRGLDDSLEVSFVPMAAVSDLLGQITEPEIRTFGEVRNRPSRNSINPSSPKRSEANWSRKTRTTNLPPSCSNAFAKKERFQ
ncbi:MAG: hypothetical protein WKF77_27295, partial [Planctomycetaceae bacterium]